MVNVLVIVADALRKDRVGCLGGRNLTPGIDSFAEDAVRFTNAFTTSNATDVAVTTIQTGRYPISHGVMNHGQRVENKHKVAVETVPQIPQVLSEAGYSTAKIGRPLGRWHRKGFDIYPESMEGRVPTEKLGKLKSSEKQKSGLKKAEEHASGALESIHPRLRDGVAGVYNTITGKTKNQSVSETPIEEKKENKDETIERFRKFVESGAKKDWFSFVHLMDTHDYDADPEVICECLSSFDYSPYPIDVDKVSIPSALRDNILPEEYEELRDRFYYGEEPSTAVMDAAYDATVMEVDERVSKLIDILKENGEFNDTLIIFLADHGESLHQQGIMYHHHGLYESVVRVPVLVRPPGGSNGKEVDGLVSTTDIAPTIVEYTEADGLDPDGSSLKDLIETDAQSQRNYVMAEDVTQRRRMIRNESKKYICLFEGGTVCRRCGVEHSGDEEFYDLCVDPSEEYNIIAEGSEDIDKLRSELSKRIDKFKNRLDIDDSRVVEYDDEEVVHERMRALGYK